MAFLVLILRWLTYGFRIILYLLIKIYYDTRETFLNFNEPTILFRYFFARVKQSSQQRRLNFKTEEYGVPIGSRAENSANETLPCFINSAVGVM